MTRVTRHLTGDLMEEWLDMQGFYVKHTAKDGSCLFRGVSEQVFYTQSLHVEVRTACISYMERNREKFEEFVEGSYDNHLNNLKDPKEWAGQIEMSAMSLLFNHDFLVFHDVGRAPFKVTDNNFDDKIMLYFSQGNHYDSVYSKSYFVDAALCQCIVYEMLYKKVFRMGDEVDLAVEKMLHDKAYAKLRKDSTASMDSNCASSEIALDADDDQGNWNEKTDPESEVRRALIQGFPPFPYKVAKALDPDIYRNVEFDIWNEARKDEIIFEPGVKCLVRLDKDSYQAHIQEVTPNKGPVSVYIVELGAKQTVPYENLEPLPSCNKGWQTLGRSYKTQSTYYRKSQLSRNITEMASSGQNLSSRIQSHQSQFDSSFLPLGRGRGAVPYHGNSRNPSSSCHVKWLSTSSQNQRYHSRNGGSRYFTSTISVNGHNGNGNNRAYEKGPYNPRGGAQCSNSGNSTSTSVTWVKSIENVKPTLAYVASGSNGSSGNDMVTLQQHTTNHEMCFPTDPIKVPLVHGKSVTSTTSTAPVCFSTTPQVAGSLSSASPASCSGSLGCIPTLVPPNTAQTSVGSPTVLSPLQAMSPATVQSFGGLPTQPVAIYPCQYLTGACVPYEPPLQPINYSVARSQDPNGTDLPFQDVATLRFFYNLGCDYFRVASVIQISQSPPQCAFWNYGNPMGYSGAPVNGYLTPASSSDPCDVLDESSGSNGGASVPSPEMSDGEIGTPVEEQYETAYMYGSSPVSFLPGVWTQPVDYNTAASMPGLVEDYKNGLMLNEQGVLTLSPTPCAPQPFCLQQQQLASTQSRQRSDSGSSGHSQRENAAEWNNGNYSGGCRNRTMTSNGFSNNSSYDTDTSRGSRVPYKNAQPYAPQTGGLTTHVPPPHFVHRHNPPLNTPPPNSYMGQPVVQLGPTPTVQPPPPTFSIGSPILAGSPTSLGLYSTGISVSGGALYTASPAYYSPPHHPPTATIMYSPTHPQTIPYFPASAH